MFRLDQPSHMALHFPSLPVDPSLNPRIAHYNRLSLMILGKFSQRLYKIRFVRSSLDIAYLNFLASLTISRIVKLC
jgi:hypothetical protein